MIRRCLIEEVVVKAQFILEWKLFTQNIKNRIVFGVFIFICIYGAMVIEKDFEPLRPINIDVLEAEIADAEYFLQNNESSSNPRSTTLFQTVLEINPVLIQAIEQEEWQMVMVEEQNHYKYLVVDRYGYEEGYIDPALYEYDEPMYLREIRQRYYDDYTVNRYEDYNENISNLSISILEERTALQAVIRHLQSYLPAILIIMAILFSMDVFSKDMKNQTVVQNIPLSKYKNSWAKSLVVLTALTLTIFLGFIIFSIPIIIQHGFGSFSLPIPIYGWILNNTYGEQDGIWISYNIGTILLQAIILLYLIFILFIRLIYWINIFIKRTYITILTIPVLFINQLWHRPGVTYSTSVYNYLPATYFRVGEALTGQLNILYLSNTITFGTGLISLALTLFFLECIIIGSLAIKRKIK